MALLKNALLSGAGCFLVTQRVTLRNRPLARAWAGLLLEYALNSNYIAVARYEQKLELGITSFLVLFSKVMYIGINGILPVLLVCVYKRLCVTTCCSGVVAIGGYL